VVRGEGGALLAAGKKDGPDPIRTDVFRTPVRFSEFNHRIEPDCISIIYTFGLVPE
jgi:hypothetical protein